MEFDMQTLPNGIRQTGIVVLCAAALVLGFGARAAAVAPPDPIPVFNGGYPQPVVVCGGVVHDAPFTCPVVTPTVPCHKWRWWVIRHHHKHYYWACREYPLP